jgi:hypothetical protein
VAGLGGVKATARSLSGWRPVNPAAALEKRGNDVGLPATAVEAHHRGVMRLVIDNRATMHRAPGDYDRAQSRVPWRIILEGDRPRLV